MFSLCSHLYLDVMFFPHHGDYKLHVSTVKVMYGHVCPCDQGQGECDSCFITLNQTEIIKRWLSDQSHDWMWMMIKNKGKLCSETILRKSDLALEVWYPPYGTAVLQLYHNKRSWAYPDLTVLSIIYVGGRYGCFVSYVCWSLTSQWIKLCSVSLCWQIHLFFSDS